MVNKGKVDFTAAGWWRSLVLQRNSAMYTEELSQVLPRFRNQGLEDVRKQQQGMRGEKTDRVLRAGTDEIKPESLVVVVMARRSLASQACLEISKQEWNLEAGLVRIISAPTAGRYISEAGWTLSLQRQPRGKESMR